METRVAEVADRVYQLTTYIQEIDFGVNQYLLCGDEPLLFHTGMRGIYAGVSEAAARVVPVESLRWIGFGHVEADECGSLNDWLAVAPHATAIQGAIGCMVSIGDMAARAPRPLAPGEKVDIGGHCVEWIDTPHVPHGWEAGVLYDHASGVLFCGDLFSCMGSYPATTTDDIVGPASKAEDDFPSMSLHPASGSIMRDLARFDVAALALMHGPVFTGDCGAALHALADDTDLRTKHAGTA